MILFCESEVNLWNVQTVGQDAPVLKAVKQSMKQSRRLTLECCARDLWNIQVWPNSVYDLERTEAAQKNCAADAHKVIRRKRKTRFKGDFKHQLGCHQSGIMFNNNLLWQGTTNLMGRSGNCVNKRRFQKRTLWVFSAREVGVCEGSRSPVLVLKGSISFLKDRSTQNKRKPNVHEPSSCT